MNKQKNKQIIFPLLLITIYPALTYLLFVPFLGFYNDDWLFGYTGHFYGPSGLIKSFAFDRPMVGYLFALNHALLNNHVLLWHIYMFLMRLLGGYILFFLLKKLWPNRLSIITSITLLFLIYPGFLQQTSPLGYQNFLTALTVWIASLFFTILAIKSRGKFKLVSLTLAAFILQVLSFLILEFFIGMEALRFLLIFHLLKIRRIDLVELKKKIRYWSPYIVGLTIFLLWRIFIFKATREATDINWVLKTYYSNPLWIAKIPLKITYSFVSTVILAYFIPFIVRLMRIPLGHSITSFSLGIISSLLLYFYYKKVETSNYNRDLNSLSNRKKIGKELLWIGLLSILGALVPIIIAGRYVSVLSHNDFYDRYTISSIIGVGFFLTGFLFYKTSTVIRNWAVILLTAISVTTHLMNGYWYKIYWDTQKDIWWQMYWRTPKIPKNTMLIFDLPKITHNSNLKDVVSVLYRTFRREDYQIWAPGNLFFNYYNSSANHFSGGYLLNEGTSQKIRDFNNTIIISLPTEKSCLWVLDKERLELPVNSSELARSYIGYSDIDKLVQKDASITPLSKIFGLEPVKTWCYYFQKASLARQSKDWDRLYQLTQEVLEKNLKPKDINEWLPFIEGLIITKKYSQAENLIKKAVKEEKGSQVFMSNICKMFRRLKDDTQNYCQT